MGQQNPTTLPARAEAYTPTQPPNSRKLVVPVDFTWYDWWMARWENNEVLCRILVEHEGQPTVAEIRQACGTPLANEWSATKPCDLGNIATCRGMYLHFLGSFPGKRDVDIFLPLPKVWISLSDCNPTPTINRCTNIPSLLLTGEEDLPNEQIIRIQGTYAGQSFSCPGNTCVIPLRATGSQGTTLEFWADSSFGDSSEHFQAQVRVTPVGDFMAPDGTVSSSGQQWYVDVISSQWRDGNLASCSEIWQVFPDVGGPPAWLNTPVTLADMLSTRSYYYLAGRLITTGEVDASTCPDGGLISGQDQVANQCGLESALPKVIAWQNQFDTEILKVSKDTGIPAQLMKNIFGRESQFWPGLYSDINEAGLGQMTEKGADTVLLWNPTFYQKFCPLILSNETCQNGFVFLKPEEQNLLRGGLVSQVNAACPSCPLGIDLTQAEFSVNVFAESLLANCSQTGRVVSNVTGKVPGQVSSYVDLWKFTLVNYNAGVGCLWAALDASQKAGEQITWENVSARLELSLPGRCLLRGCDQRRTDHHRHPDRLGVWWHRLAPTDLPDRAAVYPNSHPDGYADPRAQRHPGRPNRHPHPHPGSNPTRRRSHVHAGQLPGPDLRTHRHSWQLPGSTDCHPRPIRDISRLSSGGRSYGHNLPLNRQEIKS